MEKSKETGVEITHKNLEPISFFEKDAVFVFVYKKTEKLASAVYIVTNLLSDSEPIKWNLRSKVGGLLSFMLNYKDISGSDQSDFVYNVKTRVLELVSLFEISFRAGLISNMNFSILKQEFSNLTLVMSSTKTTQKDSFYTQIPKNFFAQNEEGFKDGDSPKNYYTEPFNKASELLVSSGKVQSNPISNSSLKRSNRQNIIIGLLRKKKELTIKDISEVIKDCSEKTIQRELNSFIAEGVVKRTGERRWSKYWLA